MFDKKKKVFVAMSGGVDSSVVAALLKKQGDFDIVGAHMKCWSEGEYCTSQQDAEDARRVANKLDIPFYVFDFEGEYREKVFKYMLDEFRVGRTPNPDVMCNSEIKFGIFLEKALSLGADYIATGHYVRGARYLLPQTGGSPLPASGARLRSHQPNFAFGEDQASAGSEGFSEVNIGQFKLLQAKDKNKDQSYFLWKLTQKQLKRALFPLGEYTKPQVREMAHEFGLPIADKKDSQGLCFVGDIKLSDFLREIIPQKQGAVVTSSGKDVGQHDGLEFYTIGQRHGIGIGGGVPYYVAEKDFKNNRLIVSEGPYEENLYKKELVFTGENWISGTAPIFPLVCEARIRYRQPLQKCTIENNKVIFDEAQKAVTPGQSIVFYKNEEMLGGGIIE